MRLHNKIVLVTGVSGTLGDKIERGVLPREQRSEG